VPVRYVVKVVVVVIVIVVVVVFVVVFVNFIWLLFMSLKFARYSFPLWPGEVDEAMMSKICKRLQIVLLIRFVFV
jgi:lysylphosphatidylglycerol synthetase-like protein (DUF2156 family)